MSRNLATLLVLGFLALAPLVAAQDESSGGKVNDSNPQDPPDKAWVDDCPPDMMCAAQQPPGDECSPEAPCSHGDEPKGETCMDGQQEGEVCDPDVVYLDGRGPPDCENCRGDAGSSEDPVTTSNDDEKRDVSSVATLGVIGAFVAGVALVALRHKDR